MITIKKIITLFLFIISINYAFAQTSKIAILDFENTSGKSEYDALGKSLSSMLISELRTILNGNYEFYDITKEQNEKTFNISNHLDLAIKIGIEKNLDLIIIGKIIAIDNTIKFEANGIDIHTKKNIFTITLKDKIENWLILKKDLANKIVEKLK
jgi:TolB-like protein